MEDIDDLDVFDVRDCVSGIAKMFYVVLKTFIMLLPDGLQGLCCRWMLVHALEVANDMAHSWSHEVIEHSGKLISHDLVASVNTVGRKLAFTRSSPPVASMTV
jgi:hypothetical protein